MLVEMLLDWDYRILLLAYLAFLFLVVAATEPWAKNKRNCDNAGRTRDRDA